MLNGSLAMISFASPWMAWGAIAAVGLPVLAHLLSRTRYHEAVFPPARLVRRAVAATSRIETPRHRLLMLLRWLVLMLLVLAFMRPQWTPSAEADDQDRGILLVLLVDASASMQRTREGASLYDRARREAQRLLEQLDPARDVAAVVTVDREPASLLPVPTAQISRLAEQLAATEPGYTRADWPAAVAAAQRLARDQGRAVRIVTLSDQQGEAPQFASPSREADTPPIEHLRIDGPIGNTAIRLVNVRPYPAIRGRPITATIETRHFGDRPATVDLFSRTEPREIKRTITLGPDERRRLDFELPAVSGDTRRIEFELSTIDALAADNLAGAVVPVQQTHTALIVHDADAASQKIADRLALVLNPGGRDEARLPQIDTVALNDANAMLDDLNPAAVRTIVLINEEPLPDAASQSLETYAQRGGGVVRFTMNPASDQTQATTAFGIDFNLRPLRVFEGPARAGLAALPWPDVSNSAIDPRAETILEDQMQRVIVAHMPRGRGRLIAINTRLSDDPGGLLAQPAFVVLLNELCRYASPGLAMPEPMRPGDAMPGALLAADQRVVPKDADAAAEVFTSPGLYAATTTDGAIEDGTFVELHPQESDTRKPTDWSNTAAPDFSTTVLADQANETTTRRLRSETIEWWPVLLVAALVLAAVESLLLWRYAQPTSPAVQGGPA